MKIGVLGTGMVGATLATKLVQLGHEVKMGSRKADSNEATDWAKANGNKASHGTFEDAAKFGEMIVISVKGDAALEVIKSAKPDNFKGKTLLDTCNPLDFSGGTMKLFVTNTDSLGEQIQRAVPDAKVVKTLNTVGSVIMTDPKRLGEEISIFMCGNNESSKKEVTEMLKKFGWTDIIDLGDITAARGMEMVLPLWARMFSTWQHPNFAWKIVRKK